jgi:hypothetical protein
MAKIALRNLRNEAARNNLDIDLSATVDLEATACSPLDIVALGKRLPQFPSAA